MFAGLEPTCKIQQSRQAEARISLHELKATEIVGDVKLWTNITNSQNKDWNRFAWQDGRFQFRQDSRPSTETRIFAKDTSTQDMSVRVNVSEKIDASICIKKECDATCHSRETGPITWLKANKSYEFTHIGNLTEDRFKRLDIPTLPCIHWLTLTSGWLIDPTTAPQYPHCFNIYTLPAYLHSHWDRSVLSSENQHSPEFLSPWHSRAFLVLKIAELQGLRTENLQKGWLISAYSTSIR